MQTDQFDEAAKAFASGALTRRQTLKALLLGALAVSFTGGQIATAGWATAAPCNPSGLRACLDTALEKARTCRRGCGPLTACERACSEQHRRDVHACHSTLVCAPPQTCCGGGCVNTQTDSNHCGACDSPCPAGTRCCEGQCKVPCGALCGCPTGEFCCAGSCAPDGSTCCVDVSGAVVGICKPGETCCFNTLGNSGTCTGADETCCPDGISYSPRNPGDHICCQPTGGASACSSTQLCCSGACKDVRTDSSNCGSCGNVCPPGLACNNGSCQCPDNGRLCHGRCFPAGSTCCGSPEGPACPPTFTCCEGTFTICVDNVHNVCCIDRHGIPVPCPAEDPGCCTRAA